ncbi:MAG: hypothetical protein E6J28_15020 [Chloroflexi bacterium]|nr:MAG: hypothetical protein E6J28_15020 [Chloroflexota bacterium]
MGQMLESKLKHPPGCPVQQAARSGGQRGQPMRLRHRVGARNVAGIRRERDPLDAELRCDERCSELRGMRKHQVRSGAGRLQELDGSRDYLRKSALNPGTYVTWRHRLIERRPGRQLKASRVKSLGLDGCEVLGWHHEVQIVAMAAQAIGDRKNRKYVAKRSD